MGLSKKTLNQLEGVKDGLDTAGLVDFSFIQNELEIAEPRVRALPHLWKWNDTKPWLHKTYADMSLKEVHRRTLGHVHKATTAGVTVEVAAKPASGRAVWVFVHV